MVALSNQSNYSKVIERKINFHKLNFRFTTIWQAAGSCSPESIALSLSLSLMITRSDPDELQDKEPDPNVGREREEREKID